MPRHYAIKRKHYPSTPFTIWLYDYANKNKTTLAQLALDAGLSRGLLNIFVAHPERSPNLQTCLRVSEATGKPAGEILQLAGIAGYKPQKAVDPDLKELVNIYQRLPVPMKYCLLKSARALAEAVKAQKSPSVSRQPQEMTHD
jgi:hypothetical protein